MYTVLIADVDGERRDRLAQALSLDRCQIELVSTAEGMLREISRRDVDVIVTEVHLSDASAWDFLPKVHEIEPHVPVIAVTSDDSWETSRRVRVEGASVFFYGLKPLNLWELRRVVQRAGVQRWKSSCMGVTMWP